MELGTVREIPRQKWNAAPGLPQVYPHIIVKLSILHAD